jgi:hypothetical protein
MSATIHSITDAARKPDAKVGAGGLLHEAMIAELKAQLEATRQKLQAAEKRAESWRRLFEAERRARRAAAAQRYIKFATHQPRFRGRCVAENK